MRSHRAMSNLGIGHKSVCVASGCSTQVRGVYGDRTWRALNDPEIRVERGHLDQPYRPAATHRHSYPPPATHCNHHPPETRFNNPPQPSATLDNPKQSATALSAVFNMRSGPFPRFPRGPQAWECIAQGEDMRRALLLRRVHPDGPESCPLPKWPLRKGNPLASGIASSSLCPTEIAQARAQFLRRLGHPFIVTCGGVQKAPQQHRRAQRTQSDMATGQSTGAWSRQTVESPRPPPQTQTPKLHPQHRTPRHTVHNNRVVGPQRHHTDPLGGRKPLWRGRAECRARGNPEPQLTELVRPHDIGLGRSQEHRMRAPGGGGHDVLAARHGQRLRTYLITGGAWAQAYV